MKEKWEIVEHSWSDTSIYNQDGRLICTKSIDDEDTTEENQDEREEEVYRDFNLIVCGQEALEVLEIILKEYELGIVTGIDSRKVKELLNRAKNDRKGEK